MGSTSRLAWSPVILGILVTPVAIHMASIMALSGPGALTMLYPYVQIVKSPALNVPGEFAYPIAQWLMYLQFPLYGLAMAMIMRVKGFWVGLNAVIFLHAAGVGVAYLLAHMQNHYLRFF